MKKQICRFAALCLSILMLIPAVTSCSSSPKVMSIGDFTVSYDLVRYFAMNYMSDYGDLTPEDFKNDPALQEQLQKNVLSSITHLAAYSELADDYNIRLTKQDEQKVEEELKDIKNSYKSDKEYKQALADNFVTEDVLRTIHRVSALCDGVYDYLTNEYTGIFKSDDATIEKDIADGNWFSAEYLYVSYDGEKQHDSRKEFTEELYKQIQDGKTMKVLYEEHRTTYNLGITYNNLGGFTYTQENEYFEKAVTEMNIGDYSEVIEREDGFLIIHRLPLDEDYIEEFFVSTFVAGYLEREFFNFVEDYAAKLEVTYAKKYQDLKFWEIE